MEAGAYSRLDLGRETIEVKEDAPRQVRLRLRRPRTRRCTNLRRPALESASNVSDDANSEPLDVAGAAEAIDQLVADIAPAKFAQRSAVANLVQGLEALQTMAETGQIVPSTATSSSTATTTPPAASATATPPVASKTSPLRYPVSLVSPLSMTSPARRARREQILDTPHAVSCHRGGWFSINLRRKKGELAIFRERGEAKGRDAVSLGRLCACHGLE